ncbi:hypothetical protein SKAU_G00156010 [Synaphobranchus kaupii]|uniref:PHD-type domain-containing protein n=1 Tax=Synaphobranchus kaupii TaxID=118154 RepID=A0A9Q1FHP6_SYNKA|nr:hypothetical protein SKAU_G00156010 [Synaphobranchus kaupii]
MSKSDRGNFRRKANTFEIEAGKLYYIRNRGTDSVIREVHGPHGTPGKESLTRSKTSIKKLVKQAWAGKEDYVLLSKIGPYKIFFQDIKRTRPNDELESEVINAYLHIIVQEYNGQTEKKAQFIDSFAMTNIWNQKTTKIRIDPLLYKVILGIVNDHNHWTLTRALFLDPFGESATDIKRCQEATRAFMRKKGCNVSRWACSSVPHSRQTDGTSCGVFALKETTLDFDNSAKAITQHRWQMAMALLENTDDLSSLCHLCGAMDSDEPDWIACDKCSRWYHQTCVRRPAVEAEYICAACSEEESFKEQQEACGHEEEADSGRIACIDDGDDTEEHAEADEGAGEEVMAPKEDDRGTGSAAPVEVVKEGSKAVEEVQHSQLQSTVGEGTEPGASMEQVVCAFESSLEEVGEMEMEKSGDPDIHEEGCQAVEADVEKQKEKPESPGCSAGVNDVSEEECYTERRAPGLEPLLEAMLTMKASRRRKRMVQPNIMAATSRVLERVCRGPGVWCLNSAFLSEKAYSMGIRELIGEELKCPLFQVDKRVWWDNLKYRVKMFSIEYGVERKRWKGWEERCVREQLDREYRRVDEGEVRNLNSLGAAGLPRGDGEREVYGGCSKK